MTKAFALAITVVLAQFAASGQNTDAPPPTTPAGVAGTTTEPTNFVPPTGSERFRDYLLSTYSIASIFESAAAAGIRQWENAPKEWKQGGEGYRDRLGSSYASHVIRSTLEYGAAAALREDNRYVRSGDTGFWRRSKHAVVSTVIAKNYAGQEHFAYSRFGSAAASALIWRTWQPHSTNSAGDSAVLFGVTIGADMARNLFNEFWPEVRRHVRRKRE